MTNHCRVSDPPNIEEKWYIYQMWTITAKAALKRGLPTWQRLNQNDSGPIKTKLKNWILLAFCFTERNKSYAHTSNEASLPQEGYEDRMLLGTTINRWYRFFRKLCRNDFQRQGGRICVKVQRALLEKFRLRQKI